MSLGTLGEGADRIERLDGFKKCITIIKVAYDKIKEQKRGEGLDSLLLDSKKIVQVSELVEELKKSALMNCTLKSRIEKKRLFYFF